VGTRINEVVGGIYRISTWQPQYAHELPIRQVVDRLEKMNLSWVHPMHGGSFEQGAFPDYARALHENEFAYRGMLLGREIAKVALM